MRLIDVDEAIVNFGFEWDDIPPTREEFVRFLKKQPTVDAVPVVRCRECVHYEMGVCLKIYDDGAASRYAWQERKPDDFCSYGEKRCDEDGTT